MVLKLSQMVPPHRIPIPAEGKHFCHEAKQIKEMFFDDLPLILLNTRKAIKISFNNQ